MGLYDADYAAVTGGDVNDKAYWIAKVASETLEEALKAKQPEGAIKSWLPKAFKAHDAVLAKYKNHADVKKWRERAAEIEKKITVDRYDPWKEPFPPGFDWYAEFRAMLGWMRLAMKQGDWANAREAARLARGDHNYIERGPLKKWPDALKTAIAEEKGEADRIFDEAKQHV